MISCVSEEAKLEKQISEAYVAALNEFGPDLTDHFPSSLISPRQFSVIYPAGAIDNGMAFFIYTQQVDSSEFRSTIAKLNSNNIQALNPKDSAFIIIGDSLEYRHKTSFQSYERDFGLNNKYLTENHTLYILESREGIYMDHDYLPTNRSLPKKWKHGFTRGLATNKKQNELIYWLCVW